MYQSVYLLLRYDSSLVNFWPINSIRSSQTDFIGGKTATSSVPTYQADQADIAVTMSSGTASLYINGVLSASGPAYSPRNVQRTTNYFGYSAWSDTCSNIM